MRSRTACLRFDFGFPLLILAAVTALVADTALAEISLGQGTMCGEVTPGSALVQARLTEGTTLNANGDLPGAAGVVAFEWGTDPGLDAAERTSFSQAGPESDYIVRAELSSLTPGTKYFYRAVYGPNEDDVVRGPVGSFTTLPGKQIRRPVRFIVGSCMNYCKFMYGKDGNAGGPITATAEDKRLGFPAFETMRKLGPDFFVGTGDIVYYDNPTRRSETVPELRRCWHEQFRFPRMIAFFQNVPTYWSKDDHDFRYNDSDNASERLPLPPTGIELFREQLPIVPTAAIEGARFRDTPTYRTHRVSRDLQIWLSEGRDFRSPNRMKDGPEKTLWGKGQREWLERTLKESDAKWKILISPTPMVGPDDAKKKDNHANLGGFRHEANAFFDWLGEQGVENFMTICGDRHWQYHSIHPSGVEEFACGALNDENARMGVPPGSKRGTDPDALIRQPYTSPEPSGGFLMITAGDTLQFEFFDAKGNRRYQVSKP